MNGTEREVKRIIDRIENKKGVKLTEEQKEKIMKNVSRKRIRRNMGRAFLLSIGFGAGVTATNLVNNYNNKGVTQTQKNINIDISEAKKDINIKNNNDLNKIFIDGIRVDLDAQKNEIEEAARAEVTNLETKKDILDYIKEIYVEEYNKSNDDKVGIKDITIKREQYIVMLDEDEAKNGDKILRVSQGYKIDKERENFPNGIISVQINSDNKIITENIVEREGKYYTVYGINEKVKKYKQNTAAKLGSILDNGINLAILREQKQENGIRDEEAYNNLVKKYEYRLINKVCEIKNNKINEIKGRNTSEKDTEENER